MATTKATTTRTRSTATASAKAHTKPVSADAKATVDLNRVSKPFYAYVGVADLAVEKLRHLPEAYSHSFSNAQEQLQEQLESARGSVKSWPQTVREQFEAVPAKARETYDEMVKRGQKLVKTVSDNPSTKAAIKQAKTARSQAKAAATSARRAVSSAEKAAEDTAAKAG